MEEERQTILKVMTKIYTKVKEEFKMILYFKL